LLGGQSAAVHAIRLDITDRAGFVNDAGGGVRAGAVEATFKDWDWLRVVYLLSGIGEVDPVLTSIRRNSEFSRTSNSSSHCSKACRPC
jgi:hypothetical protein